MKIVIHVSHKSTGMHMPGANVRLDFIADFHLGDSEETESKATDFRGHVNFRVPDEFMGRIFHVVVNGKIAATLSAAKWDFYEVRS